jgi:hypothetical protein
MQDIYGVYSRLTDRVKCEEVPNRAFTEHSSLGSLTAYVIALRGTESLSSFIRSHTYAINVRKNAV